MTEQVKRYHRSFLGLKETREDLHKEFANHG